SRNIVVSLRLIRVRGVVCTGGAGPDSRGIGTLYDLKAKLDLPGHLHFAALQAETEHRYFDGVLAWGESLESIVAAFVCCGDGFVVTLDCCDGRAGDRKPVGLHDPALRERTAGTKNCEGRDLEEGAHEGDRSLTVAARMLM